MNWKKSSLILASVFVLIVCCILAIRGESLTGRENLGYTVEVLSIDSDKYGYRIRRNERVLIMQPFVPAVSGKQYFRSADDALRVGKLVCERFVGGKDFSVTIEDMERLGIRTFTE